MNKTEFINAVAEKSGLSKVDAKKAVEAFVETVSSELKEGGKVALLGFGSFSVAAKCGAEVYQSVQCVFDFEPGIGIWSFVWGDFFP